jgi:hypothetical protein
MDDEASQRDLACGIRFMGDDEMAHRCTLLKGHPGGHTDIPAPPAPDIDEPQTAHLEN